MEYIIAFKVLVLVACTTANPNSHASASELSSARFPDRPCAFASTCVMRGSYLPFIFRSPSQLDASHPVGGWWHARTNRRRAASRGPHRGHWCLHTAHLQAAGVERCRGPRQPVHCGQEHGQASHPATHRATGPRPSVRFFIFSFSTEKLLQQIHNFVHKLYI